MKSFNKNEVVYNNHYNTIGIVLDDFNDGEIRTDADGVVYAEDCIKINTNEKLEDYLNKGAKIAPSTMKLINENNLLNYEGI